MVSNACLGGVIWLLFFVKKKMLMGWLQFGIFDAFVFLFFFGVSIWTHNKYISQVVDQMAKSLIH